jgi:hypothetical protein
MPEIRAQVTGFHADALGVWGFGADRFGDGFDRGLTFSFPDSLAIAIHYAPVGH